MKHHSADITREVNQDIRLGGVVGVAGDRVGAIYDMMDASSFSS